MLMLRAPPLSKPHLQAHAVVVHNGPRSNFVATTRPRCKEMEGGCIWIMTSLSRKKLVCRQRLLCLVISYVHRDDNQEVLHS